MPKLKSNTPLELVKMIRPGDTVTALFPAGIGCNGREFKERSGKVNPMLIFDEHVVINLGGRHGTPGVVDARNIVSVSRPKQKEPLRVYADELPERDFYEGDSPDF